MKIVKISAVWCSACLITNANFDSVIKDYPDIEVLNYDYDFDEEVSKYNVSNILPVMILFKDGEEIRRMVGEKSKKEIKDFIGCAL